MNATTQPKIPVGVLLHGSLPVPYVAAWSSESELEIRPDPLISNRPALFRGGRRGEGRPVFGKMDERRVRRVLVERRCQVCASVLRNECFVLDVPVGRDGNAPLMNEPPACRACFELSIALCPGIRRLVQRPRVLAARVRQYRVLAVTMQPVEGGDDDLNAVLSAWHGEPPVGYARAALTDYDVLDIASLLPWRES